jgi:DMSO reductase family type II enzyme heme b subunit
MGKVVRPDNTVIKAVRLDNELPVSPNDPAWNEASPTTFFMVPQIVGKDRFFKAANDTISVRAFYNADNISIRLEWDDRTKSIPGDAKAKSIAEEELTEDAVAVQFPVQIPRGMEKPYFLMGDAANPVTLWRWSSGTTEEAESATTVDAKGIDKQETRDAATGLIAKGIYKAGTWSTIMTRPLRTETGDTDLQFEEGRFIPIAFFAWDGSNGEAGTRHAMTTWYWLLLEPSAGIKPIIFAIIATLLISGVLVWWGRSAAARSRSAMS